MVKGSILQSRKHRVNVSEYKTKKKYKSAEKSVNDRSLSLELERESSRDKIKYNLSTNRTIVTSQLKTKSGRITTKHLHNM